jgi:hypothetical protein
VPFTASPSTSGCDCNMVCAGIPFTYTPSRPTIEPTAMPSRPTVTPTRAPSGEPSKTPTRRPTCAPSNKPSGVLTGAPSTHVPTSNPSSAPAAVPSANPTSRPTTRSPVLIRPAKPTKKPKIDDFGRSREVELEGCQCDCSPTPSPSHVPTGEPSGNKQLLIYFPIYQLTFVVFSQADHFSHQHSFCSAYTQSVVYTDH